MLKKKIIYITIPINAKAKKEVAKVKYFGFIKDSKSITNAVPEKIAEPKNLLPYESLRTY